MPKTAEATTINNLRYLWEGCIDEHIARTMLGIRDNTLLGDIASIKWREWNSNHTIG